MKKIKDITPYFSGYKDYPKDDDGKILLPRNDDGVILIYRRNTISYGCGLIGLLDGSKIATSEWEQLRRCFIIIDEDGTEHFYWSIGGSDSGTCMGVSPFSTVKELYNNKKNNVPMNVDDERDYLFEYGHRNEELIAKGFQTLTKMEVVQDNTVFFNEKIGFMQANIDFFVRHPDGAFSILEIKTLNSGNVIKINDYKNGRVPLNYYSQAVLHYPIVLGNVYNIKGTFFAAAYNNSLKDILICHFDRDRKQEGLLLSAEKEFADCLKYSVEPTDDKKLLSSSALFESVKRRFPVAQEKKVKLSPQTIKAVEEYLTLNSQISELKKKQDKISESLNLYKTMVMEEMKDCELSEEYDIGDTRYYCSYKNSKKETVDKTVLKNKYPEIFNEVVTTTSSRTFRISKVKRKK